MPCLGENDWGGMFLRGLDFAPVSCLLFDSNLTPECHRDSVAKRFQVSGALERLSAGYGQAGRERLGGTTSSVAPAQLWPHTLAALDPVPTSLSKIYQGDLNGILHPLQPSPCKTGPMPSPLSAQEPGLAMLKERIHLAWVALVKIRRALESAATAKEIFHA